MGYGLGAAIGGCFACGKKRTVLFTGDGSFGMNLNEMATAVKQNLPLTIILINNDVLGMVRQWQTILERQTDYPMLAKAFGAEGYRASNIAELQAALDAADKAEGSVLIECKIGKDERVLPMIPAGRSIKEVILN
jgi:acetolactate synthase-1/2/3 large subunit